MYDLACSFVRAKATLTLDQVSVQGSGQTDIGNQPVLVSSINASANALSHFDLLEVPAAIDMEGWFDKSYQMFQTSDN